MCLCDFAEGVEPRVVECFDEVVEFGWVFGDAVHGDWFVVVLWVV